MDTEFILISEAAQLIGVSVHRVGQLVHEGRIDAKRTTNNTRLFKRSDVLRYAAEREANRREAEKHRGGARI